MVQNLYKIESNRNKFNHNLIRWFNIIPSCVHWQNRLIRSKMALIILHPIYAKKAVENSLHHIFDLLTCVWTTILFKNSLIKLKYSNLVHYLHNIQILLKCPYVRPWFHVTICKHLLIYYHSHSVVYFHIFRIEFINPIVIVIGFVMGMGGPRIQPWLYKYLNRIDYHGFDMVAPKWLR